MQFSLVRLNGQNSSHNPLDSWRVQPLNYVHNFNLTKQPKEKWPHLKSMSCYLFMSNWLRAVSLSRLPVMQNMVKMEKAMPSTAASSFNTHSTDRVKPEKWTAVSLYLNELSSYAEHGENGKGDAQYCGKQFQHSLDRQSETWKVNGCFTLLKRITNSKV